MCCQEEGKTTETMAGWKQKEGRSLNKRLLWSMVNTMMIYKDRKECRSIMDDICMVLSIFLIVLIYLSY